MSKLLASAYLMGAADAAPDLVQETMIVAGRKWEKQLYGRSAGERHTYLKTTLVRLILRQRHAEHTYWDLLRRLAARAVTEDRGGPVADEELMLGRLSPSNAMRALEGLPPQQRIVMTLRSEGFIPAEIATIMRLSQSAVRSHLMYARATLIQSLGAEGGHDA
jgi:DNA-directed RNA polymerase specialized sigma24 family protein